MVYSGGLEHTQSYRPSRAYCVYYKENRLNWKPKKPKAFGTNIINISKDFIGFKRSIKPRIRGLKTQWGCNECNIQLYKIGDCWDLRHRRI
jgi:hypothetical protein